MAPRPRIEVCELGLAFAGPWGIATAERLLSGSILAVSGPEWIEFLLRQLAVCAGGPLLGFPVRGIGIALNGVPEPMVQVINSLLPGSPDIAKSLAKKYRWHGDLPLDSFTTREGGSHGQGQET